MSNVAGPVSSSSMISLQRSMHSSQMYTPGPAMSFLTCRCDLPQKLQRSCSFESVGRATEFLPRFEGSAPQDTPRRAIPLPAWTNLRVRLLEGEHERRLVHVAPAPV